VAALTTAAALMMVVEAGTFPKGSHESDFVVVSSSGGSSGLQATENAAQSEGLQPRTPRLRPDKSAAVASRYPAVTASSARANV
jgi:hypothetical protein